MQELGETLGEAANEALDGTHLGGRAEVVAVGANAFDSPYLRACRGPRNQTGDPRFWPPQLLPVCALIVLRAGCTHDAVCYTAAA